MDKIIEYGPTATIAHLHCPTLRVFEKEWQVRKPWQPYMLVGSAMSDGLEVYMLDPTATGLSLAYDRIERTIEKGMVEGTEWTYEALSTITKKGLLKASETTLAEILENEGVIGTQMIIGRGRVDLVTQNTAQEIIVTDDKTSIQKQSRYIQSELKETELSWQLFDYAWRVGKVLSRPVTWVRKHVIVLTPTLKCYLSDPVKINPGNLDQWASSAHYHWSRMTELDEFPFDWLPQDYTWCENRFGRCPAYEACHNLLRDEKAMEQVYDRRVRR